MLIIATADPEPVSDGIFKRTGTVENGRSGIKINIEKFTAAGETDECRHMSRRRFTRGGSLNIIHRRFD
jgi:hypothetical protein